MLNFQELQLMHQGYIWRVVSSLWFFVVTEEEAPNMSFKWKDKFSGNSYHLFKSEDL